MLCSSWERLNMCAFITIGAARLSNNGLVVLLMILPRTKVMFLTVSRRVLLLFHLQLTLLFSLYSCCLKVFNARRLGRRVSNFLFQLTYSANLLKTRPSRSRMFALGVQRSVYQHECCHLSPLGALIKSTTLYGLSCDVPSYQETSR